MALITTQTVDADGQTITFAAAAAGDKVEASDHVTLRVINGGGAPITVTLAATRQCNQGSLHNRPITCPNQAAPTEISLAPARQFADELGQVAITYSSTTSVTRAAVRS